MCDSLTCLTNLILPVVLSLLAWFSLSTETALLVIAAFLIGGAVTVLFIEKEGGEHPLVVFTGWYAGIFASMFGFFDEKERKIPWPFR